MAAGEARMPGPQLRVLVVDDDELAREGIALTLRDLGCDVTTAQTAAEAANTFLRGRFDLITLDYRMPDMNGVSLHKVLSEEFGAGKRTDGFAPRKLPPVLIVTAYGCDPEVVRAQLGESVIGVLQKPFIADELARIVNELRAARPVRPS